MTPSNETSRQWFERAQKIIPGGVSSPVRAFRHVGTTPIYFERAEGPFLFDIEGKQYVDFCLAFGPHFLGHSPPKVVKAIQKQVEKATTFGACHPLEVQLGEWILRAYPFLQKVRLVNSGTEAVMTAVRLARGFSGKSKILTFEGCYHGHSDGLLARAGSGIAELSESFSAGVPDGFVRETVTVRFDQFSEIEAAFNKHEFAAVLLEPIPANFGLWVPSYDYIKAVVELARRKNTLVIFDEVISGFRVGFTGASGYYHLDPDLVTLGKIIGGGLPLAAVVGRQDIMDRLAPLGSVYQAGTLSGNPLACAAGLATIETLFEERADYVKLFKLWGLFGDDLRNLLLQKFPKVSLVQFGSMFWIFFDSYQASRFPQEMSSEAASCYRRFFSGLLEAGIYLPPSPYEVAFLSKAHDSSLLEKVLEKIRCLSFT